MRLRAVLYYDSVGHFLLPYKILLLVMDYLPGFKTGGGTATFYFVPRAESIHVGAREKVETDLDTLLEGFKTKGGDAPKPNASEPKQTDTLVEPVEEVDDLVEPIDN